MKSAKRVVIKIGSAQVVDVRTSAVHKAWMAELAADILAMRAAGREVILVSSGAVALARAHFKRGVEALKLEEKQAFAACGQIALMHAWQEAFGASQPVAQLLLTAEDTEDRRRYLNARNTLEALLSLGAIPVVNENDTVATAEIRFGDNDRLAARVAQMAGADHLVLLSDIDGLYTANPQRDAAAQHIAEVKQLTPAVEAMAEGANSAASNGGMRTKIEAAKIALASGCHMAIARGSEAHILQKLEDGSAKATWFLASETPANARKGWIVGSLQPAGTLVVDAGAQGALKQGKSLLPAGVVRVEGSFERGDAVWVCNEAGEKIAKGLVAYMAADASKIIGKRSDAIEAILGYAGRSALIHRDDLVLW